MHGLVIPVMQRLGVYKNSHSFVTRGLAPHKNFDN